MDNGNTLLKDLNSSNGTFVNGSKITEQYLKPGDNVKCAAIVLNWQQYLPVRNKPAENTATTKPVAATRPIVASPVASNEIHSGNIPGQQQVYNAPPVAQASAVNYQPATPEAPPQIQQNVIIVGKAKSVGMAFLLAFFFGPLGLLYSSVTGGIVMFLVNVVVGILTLGFGLFITWPICCIWAIVAANNANAAMRNSAGSYINNNY